MTKQCGNNFMVPLEILSKQQKEIYKMYCQGLSNKEIAEKLNIEQRTVATQLSRIRKKASKLNFTYKIQLEAEHAQNYALPDSPADELKKKILKDPGFFKLMFNKYGTNDESFDENRYRLASCTQNPALLSNARARQIKIIAASGGCSNHDKVIVRIGKEARQGLREYLQKQKIRPLQTYWDDGSAVYLVTSRDFKRMQQILSSGFND